MFHVEVYSKQPNPPDEDAERAALAAANDPAWARQVELKSAYMQAVEAYRQARATFSFKDAEVTVSNRDVAESVVFDEDLYTTLFDIYTIEGWKGVRRVEAALLEQVQAGGNEVLPGGTSGSKWVHAKTLFDVTRNLLMLLIRDALLDIERAVAQQVYGRLNDTAAAVAEAWTVQFEFGLPRASPASRMQKTGGEVSIETPPAAPTFRMGNRPLADALLGPMSAAVEQKRVFEDALRQLPRVNSALDRARSAAHTSNVPYEASEEGSKARQLESEAAALAHVSEAAKSLYSKAHELIEMKCPLALLALDSLPPGFDGPRMEDALGTILYALHTRNDELATAVDPGKSRAAVRFASIGLTRYTRLHELEPRAIPSLGLEDFVIEEAIKAAVDDPGWIPLLSEPTLHRLTQSGAIAEDSFEYVVWFHYVTTLIDRIEALGAREEAARALWTRLSVVAMGLSIASLVTPVSAPAAVPLRTVAFIADLALMANAVHSVGAQLATFDRTVAEALVQPDAFGVAVLARLGQLVSMRAELMDDIALHIAIEVVLQQTPARFVMLRRLLLVRGYYLDIMGLLEDHG